MPHPPDDLAMRKRLLVARSTLARLRLQHDAAILRAQFTPGAAGAAIARSSAARSAAFLLAVEIVGPARMARLLGHASRSLALARLARLALAWLRQAPR